VVIELIVLDDTPRPISCKSSAWFREFRKEFTNYLTLAKGSYRKVRFLGYPSSSRYEPKCWNSYRRKDIGQIVADQFVNSGTVVIGVKVTYTSIHFADRHCRLSTLTHRQTDNKHMKFNLANRKTHYWLTPFLAIPILIITLSGLLLQVKKQWSWVQPTEMKGSSAAPSIPFESMLNNVKKIKGFESATWKEVKRIDVRPSKGIAKLSMSSGIEIQMDTDTGEVLQTAIRRSDWIESLHDGSYFAGDWTKLGVFLPAAVFLLVLWLTGLWMFWLPFQTKWRKAIAKRKRS
jgi:hypothetical protein